MHSYKDFNNKKLKYLYSKCSKCGKIKVFKKVPDMLFLRD